MDRHKWADVLIAIANGETAQLKTDNGGWVDAIMCNPITDSNLEWRIKPRMIKIGDMEVPEPLRLVPKNGTEYYVVSLFMGPSKKTWGDYDHQSIWLSMGLVHLDRDAAIAHAKALIKVSGGTV